MKKFTLIGLVIVLLAFSAIPVLAAGPNHGHGNGANSSQSSNGGEKNQNKGQTNNHGRGNRVNAGTRGNNNAASKRMRTPFYLQGTIESINTTAMTVTVQVVHGNAQVKQFVGAVDMPITIVFTDTTRIFKITQTGDEDETETVAPAPSTSSTDDETPANRVAITFADLKVGDIVAIHGNVVETTANNVVTRAYNATLATVYVREVTGQPQVEVP